MGHDIFISYAKEDVAVADAICRGFEERARHCWYAPRNVPVGAPWGAEIIEAIVSSKAMVLVLSEHSNRSTFVRNELERAASHGVRIIPFRIEDVLPSAEIALFISSSQWLDAFGASSDHIEELVRRVETLLAGTPEGDVRRGVGPKLRRRSRAILVALALALVAVAVVGLASYSARKTAASDRLPDDSDGAPRLPPEARSEIEGADDRNATNATASASELDRVLDGLPSPLYVVLSTRAEVLRNVPGDVGRRIAAAAYGEAVAAVSAALKEAADIARLHATARDGAVTARRSWDDHIGALHGSIAIPREATSAVVRADAAIRDADFDGAVKDLRAARESVDAVVAVWEMTKDVQAGSVWEGSIRGTDGDEADVTLKVDSRSGDSAVVTVSAQNQEYSEFIQADLRMNGTTVRIRAIPVERNRLKNLEINATLEGGTLRGHFNGCLYVANGQGTLTLKTGPR